METTEEVEETVTEVETIDVEQVPGEPPVVQEQFEVEATETVIEEPRVLISEVLIEGISGHPEEERLQLEAYDAMQVRPGSRVTRDELQRDLNAIRPPAGSQMCGSLLWMVRWRFKSLFR